MRITIRHGIALGICLSKTGQYDNAAISFENAVALSPDNATYKKNLAGNQKKRQAEPDLELDDGPAPARKI
jgi:Flp pilus assembly protein TadD